MNDFIHQRLAELNLTPTILAQHFGYASASPVIFLLRRRTLISRSKHFHALCELLGITEPQREAIRQAEQGRTA